MANYTATVEKKAMEGTQSHPGGTRPRVGLICNEGHSVFGEVAERLGGEGISVEFFEPGQVVDEDDLRGLTLLMNKKVDPASLHALTWAERNDLVTWNGYRTMLLGMRPMGYALLEHVGFRVPEFTFEKPSTDYVAKTFADWHFHPDPELNGEGDVYQRLVPAAPVDYKYYAVDVGTDIEVRVLKTTSKLHGEKEPLRLVSPEPRFADRLRSLMRLTDSQALGVDLVEGDDGFWAVDVNPAMSFRNAGMVDHLVESVLHRLAVVPRSERAWA
jgi:hypothetical protein